MDKETLQECKGFEWDSGNKDKNFIKHNVLNKEAEEIFFNEPLILLQDTKHSQDEPRFAAFGITNNKRKLTIIFTVRKNFIRVISARDMKEKERNFYSEKEN